MMTQEDYCERKYMTKKKFDMWIHKNEVWGLTCLLEYQSSDRLPLSYEHCNTKQIYGIR